MKYSLTLGGVLAMIAGSFIAQIGFSDSCNSEIMAKLTPLIGMFPGAIAAWMGRFRRGDITLAGFKK